MFHLIGLFIVSSTLAEVTTKFDELEMLESGRTVNITSLDQTGGNYSAFPEIDVRTLLLIINDIGKKHVQFLYSQEYEDTVSSIARILSKEFKGLTSFNNDGLMSTVNSLLTKAIHSTLLVLLDSPINVIEIFRMMKSKIMISHVVTWLLVVEGYGAESTVPSLEYLVPEGTHVRIFAKEPRGSFKAYLSHVNTVGVTRFTIKGEWGSLKEVNSDLFVETDQHHPTDHQEKSIHYSVSGRHMTIGVKSNYISTEVGEIYPDGSVELKSGGDVSIIRALSSALNFTYTAVLAPGNNWGFQKPDGKITGLLGIVARREVSFGISAMAMTEEREQIVDYTFLYFYPRLLLLSRSPKKKNKAFAIMTSFRPEVWLCVSVSVMFMGLAIHIISMPMSKNRTMQSKLSLQRNTFNIYRNLVIQGNHIPADTWPKKFTLFSWYLFCLIFSALYSGMLTAVLAVPTYEMPIDSLEDLPQAVKEGFTVGVIGDTTNEYFFKSATSGIFKQTYDLFNHEDRSKSFVDGPLSGLHRVLKEKFIFIIADAYAEAYARKNGKENFHFSRERFLPTYPAVACQVGSPFRDTFSYTLIKMQQGGLVAKWVEDEYRKIREIKSSKDDDKDSSITLIHLQAAYYMLFLGASISTTVMLIENLVFLNKHRK